MPKSLIDTLAKEARELPPRLAHAARYVTLPYESHGYVARESIEHTLYEMLAWFDRHVKNAQPRGGK